MSDITLGRFAVSVQFPANDQENWRAEYEVRKAKHNLIVSAFDKLPEDQPFVIRYRTNTLCDVVDSDNGMCEVGDIDSYELELEVMPVQTMQVTRQEFYDSRAGLRPITIPESFWDKAKSWYADAQKGVPYDGPA